jgi:hypothetical protein
MPLGLGACVFSVDIFMACFLLLLLDFPCKENPQNEIGDMDKRIHGRGKRKFLPPPHCQRVSGSSVHGIGRRAGGYLQFTDCNGTCNGPKLIKDQDQGAAKNQKIKDKSQCPPWLVDR